jgi:hypothetical protein
VSAELEKDHHLFFQSSSLTLFTLDLKNIIRQDLTSYFYLVGLLSQFSRLSPLKKGKMSDLMFLTGKPVNRKRAQPVNCEYF